MKKFFSSSDEVDLEIRTLFKDDLLKLASGEYEQWKVDKYGKLAAVLLSDQYSRNIFRKQKQAFDYDHIALKLVKELTNEDVLAYAYSEQPFLCLPFEHSESIED